MALLEPSPNTPSAARSSSSGAAMTNQNTNFRSRSALGSPMCAPWRRRHSLWDSSHSLLGYTSALSHLPGTGHGRQQRGGGQHGGGDAGAGPGRGAHRAAHQGVVWSVIVRAMKVMHAYGRPVCGAHQAAHQGACCSVPACVWSPVGVPVCLLVSGIWQVRGIGGESGTDRPGGERASGSSGPKHPSPLRFLYLCTPPDPATNKIMPQVNAALRQCTLEARVAATPGGQAAAKLRERASGASGPESWACIQEVGGGMHTGGGWGRVAGG